MKLYFRSSDLMVSLGGAGLFAIGVSQWCLGGATQVHRVAVALMVTGVALLVGEIVFSALSRFASGEMVDVLAPPSELRRMYVVLILLLFYAGLDLASYGASFGAPRLFGEVNICDAKITSKRLDILPSRFTLRADVACNEGAPRSLALETNRVYYQGAEIGRRIKVRVPATSVSQPSIPGACPRLCGRPGFMLALGIAVVVGWFLLREFLRRLILRVH